MTIKTEILEACTEIGGELIFDLDAFTAEVEALGATAVRYDDDYKYYEVRTLNGTVVGGIFADRNYVNANVVKEA